MSNSNMNVATGSLFSNAKNTHYVVSTFAAVVYAMVWLLSGNAEAQSSVAQNEVLPEFFVTAQRESAKEAIPEFVVWGTRETAEAVVALQEFVVYGTRENVVAQSGEKVSGGGFNASAKSGGGWVVKVRHWVQSALMK